MSRTIPVPQQKVLGTVEGPWTVSFQENRGAPAQAIFETLTPWNENPDKGIKYFSGIGTYSKTIDVPAEWIGNGARLWLDLGVVKDLAEVFVNGKSQGIIWKAPFKVDITNALQQGENDLEIRVTNLWVNRLIGDQQPDVKEKITFTVQQSYNADSPLITSGLLGPVEIISMTSE
jgi:beta-galactosidase/beta-glucuronidase